MELKTIVSIVIDITTFAIINTTVTNTITIAVCSSSVALCCWGDHGEEGIDVRGEVHVQHEVVLHLLEQLEALAVPEEKD